ncbi:MAG: PAS domain S-box protein [Ignavibacteriaceae bacterium]|nr:PAS domain S-box protein [Ignavibacteriaceae bacterium]
MNIIYKNEIVNSLRLIKMFIKQIFYDKKKNKFHLIFLIISILFLGVATFLFYSIASSKYENSLKSAQSGMEELVINQITNLIKLNFDSSSKEIIEEEIKKISSNTGIINLTLINSNDSVLIDLKLNGFKEQSDQSTFLQNFASQTNDLFKYSKIIMLPNSKALNLVCDFNRRQLNDKIINLKIEIGLISFLFFVITSLALFFTSLVIMLPLQKISNSAVEISSGDLSKRIEINGKNEFIDIANSINNLADNLQKANTHVEKLNKELKYQFRDKIGELNYEINQRRQAEFSLQQSEEQFRLLFEMAPIGMVISSVFGKILKVNAAFHTTLGYDEKEILEKKLKDLTYPEDRELDIRLHEKLINGTRPSAYYEKRLVRKDGKIIHVIVEAVLVKNKADKPSHIIEQVIDITERKSVERELIFAKEKAEESDRLKSAFLAQMSHEIRTPLNVILTAMSIIQDELNNTDEDSKEIIDSVSSAGKRLQRTIDLILNISAVQSGSYAHQFVSLDLDKELTGLLSEFKTIANEKGLSISYTNKTKNGEIKADHYSVVQIFQNLIDNAIKYTLKGSIDIYLEELSKDRLQVIIKDTGIGISKDYIGNLFSPFSQEDVGHKREFEGNGLGLALVKKYVEINDAEITVDSVKDKGSTFTVVFNKKPLTKNKSKNIPLNESNRVSQHA